jgi:alkaline phosphatase
MKVNHKSMVRMLVIVVLVSVLVASFLPAVSAAPKKPLAKNVIILISDGWGYNHIESTNYYLDGTTGQQVYEQFPFQYAMSTYEYDGSYDPAGAWEDFDYVKDGATDSAAAATAMSTGVKTYGGAIGMDPDYNPLKHAMQYAEELGKSTGVVTSVEWTHATPAGFVAHNVSRNNYAEIGAEMVYDSATDVIMGAGHPWYDRDGKKVKEPNTFKYVGGEETWLDLKAGTAGGDADGDGVDDPWALIESHGNFRSLMNGNTPKRVLGTARVYQTLQQGRGGDGYADPYAEPLIKTVPTLEEMTKAALNILDNDADGFMLMVEGGAVDWASHGNQSGRMIEEQIDFNNAVLAVVDWVKANSNWAETLVIVTGDHETGYLTGPGSDPTWESIVNNGAGVLPGMEWHSGSHTNALIPFFAQGVAAHLFEHQDIQDDPVRGDYIDNTAIFNVVLEVINPN